MGDGVPGQTQSRVNRPANPGYELIHDGSVRLGFDSGT